MLRHGTFRMTGSRFHWWCKTSQGSFSNLSFFLYMTMFLGLRHIYWHFVLLIDQWFDLWPHGQIIFHNITVLSNICRGSVQTSLWLTHLDLDSRWPYKLDKLVYSFLLNASLHHHVLEPGLNIIYSVIFLQALFVFLLLPFLSNLRGIKFAELPGYLNGGAECFLNVGESPIGNASCT